MNFLTCMKLRRILTVVVSIMCCANFGCDRQIEGNDPATAMLSTVKLEISAPYTSAQTETTLGTTVDSHLELRNTGKQSYSFDIKSSCGCLKASPAQGTISPGESRTIKVNLRFNYPGQSRTAKLFIQTSDNTNKSYVVAVSGQWEIPFRIPVDSLEGRFQTAVDAGPEIVIPLVTSSGERASLPLEDLTVDSTNAALQASVSMDDQRFTQLSISLDRSLAGASLITAGQVTVTDNASGHSVAIPVSFRRHDPVFAIPPFPIATRMANDEVGCVFSIATPLPADADQRIRFETEGPTEIEPLGSSKLAEHELHRFRISNVPVDKQRSVVKCFVGDGFIPIELTVIRVSEMRDPVVDLDVIEIAANVLAFERALATMYWTRTVEYTSFRDENLAPGLIKSNTNCIRSLVQANGDWGLATHQTSEFFVDDEIKTRTKLYVCQNGVCELSIDRHADVGPTKSTQRWDGRGPHLLLLENWSVRPDSLTGFLVTENHGDFRIRWKAPVVRENENSLGFELRGSLTRVDGTTEQVISIWLDPQHGYQIQHARGWDIDRDRDDNVVSRYPISDASMESWLEVLPGVSLPQTGKEVAFFQELGVESETPKLEYRHLVESLMLNEVGGLAEFQQEIEKDALFDTHFE